MKPLIGLAAICAVCGSAAIGSGAYIHLKAQLAQQLLKSAWNTSMEHRIPVRPWPWADTWPVARLTLKGREMIVLAGGFGEALAFGPGWLMGSAAPGVAGVTVIAGHRDTHFGVLEDVGPGDSVRIETPSGELRQYRIERTRIVDSRSWRIKVEATDRRLLLVTCYPFDAVNPGGPLRFVAEAVEHP